MSGKQIIKNNKDSIFEFTVTTSITASIDKKFLCNGKEEVKREFEEVYLVALNRFLRDNIVTDKEFYSIEKASISLSEIKEDGEINITSEVSIKGTWLSFLKRIFYIPTQGFNGLSGSVKEEKIVQLLSISLQVVNGNNDISQI